MSTDLFSNLTILPLIIGGAILLLVVLVTIVAVALPLMRLRSGSQREKQLLATGMPASARVLQIQATGVTIAYGGARRIQVMLTLDMAPALGSGAQAQVPVFIEEVLIPQVQPGCEVQIRYDPTNPTRVAVEALGAAPGTPLAAMRTGMPLGAKLGVALGIMGLIVGLGVAVVVVAVNVLGVGLDRPSNTVCGRAAACCERLAEATGNTASRANCKNAKKLGVPKQVCQQMLETFQKSAEQLGIECPE